MYLDSFVDKAAAALSEHEAPVKYLASRGFSVEDAKRWGLGYTWAARVLKATDGDWERLSKETFHFKTLEGRLIIPLRNFSGRVNGIQTRALDKKAYKDHMMSEAKAIGAFFGLREALPHIRSTRRVFVHEGAFNSMAFSRVFPNSVAALTSFLNEPQMEQLKFLADKIIIVFDNDEAGDVGRYKVTKTYGTSGIDFLTVGESDANDCLKMMGPARFDKFIRSRVPTMLQG